MTVAIDAGTAQLAARVRDAVDRGVALRIAGAGSWLDAGAPCTATERLDVGALAGIVAYEPGDLTLTARAGTSLADIERATAAHGQWLPLDPFGAPDGTIGATVATGSYGPLSTAYGTPRNQVLGCELVTGTGTVVRAGGRVVKNVAGFDITRLMVGAWGTLGALTEVTVRLRARPEVDETLAIALGGTGSVEHARRWLRTTELAPLAAELLSPALAARLGLAAVGTPVLLLRIGGNPALARAARHAAAALGDGAIVDARAWTALRAVGTADGEIALRLSDAPARAAVLWEGAWRVVEDAGGAAHANLSRGVMRITLPAGAAPHLPALLAGLPPCTRIAERAPAIVWQAIASAPRDPVRESLAEGVRRVFDPRQLLNPGIMGTA